MHDRMYWYALSGDLMTSDGTPAGTRPVVQVPGRASYGLEMVAAPDRLFFRLSDPAIASLSLVPWVSDGTAEGTRQIKPTRLETDIGGHVTLGNSLFFWDLTDDHGQEPWISDGTDAGTFELADLNPGPGSLSMDWPLPPVEMGGKLYFGGSLNAQYSIYATDGTREGTAAVFTLPDLQDADLIIPMDNGLLILGYNRIWQWSPSGGLVQISSAEGSVGNFSWAAFRGKTYFAYGERLWVTDGTAAGTAVIHDLGSQYGPMSLQVAGDWLYFLDDGYLFYDQWWRTDGTSAGTSPAPRVTGPTYGLDAFSVIERGVAAWGDYLFYYGDKGLEYTGPSAGAVDGTYGASLPVAYHDSVYFTGSYGVNRLPISALTDVTRPTLTSAVINDGAAQRSMVRKLTVTFSEPVNLSAGAVTVRLSTGQAVSRTTINVTNPTYDGQTYLLTFLGTGALGGSLPDGIFDLKITASGARDLGSNALEADYSYRFHRLFGDNNGDRAVNFLDYTRLRLTLGRSTGQTSFNDTFDYDKSGIVTLTDLTQFRRRLGRRLLY